MKNGLVSVSFRQNSPREIIEACRRVGIGAIEWGSDVHAPVGDSARLTEIAELQASYGIACSSYGTYYCIGVNKTEEIGSYIDAAHRLGTDTLRVWAGTRASADFDSEAKERLFSECIALAEIARREGAVLATEFHGGSFADNADTALELLGTVRSDNFKTYWQPDQYMPVGENIAAVNALAEHIANVHVFNWEGDNRYPLSGAVGVWREYLSSVSGEHYALLEFMPDGRLESLKDEAEALYKILQ